MHFSQLPPEIIEQILIAAIHVRGLKRGTRLRYVCKSWAAIVLHAIFRSTAIDDYRILLLDSSGATFWRSRLIAYEALGPRRSRPLRIVRRVAEAIVAHQHANSKLEDESFEHVRRCVFELCGMPYVAMKKECSREPLEWLADKPAESVAEDDMQFQQALLTGAAWMNEPKLVEQVLPRFCDHLYLICWDGWGGPHRFDLIFGSPVAMAALRGNNVVLRILVKALTASDRIHQHARDILLMGAMGDQVSTINISLELKDDPYAPTVAKALEQTGSVAVFERLLPLAQKYLENEPRHALTAFSDKWLPRQLIRAATAGNLTMVEYLLTKLETTPSARWFLPGEVRHCPVYAAVGHGHMEVFRYLLEKGFPLKQRSLMAAYRYGNPAVVREVTRMALEAKNQVYALGHPLSIAVCKESADTVEFLLTHGRALMSEVDLTKASWSVEELGSESMARLLEPAMRGKE